MVRFGVLIFGLIKGTILEVAFNPFIRLTLGYHVEVGDKVSVRKFESLILLSTNEMCGHEWTSSFADRLLNRPELSRPIESSLVHSAFHFNIETCHSISSVFTVLPSP